MTENEAWDLYKNRRKKRLKARDWKFDAADEETNMPSGNKHHGNTKIPFGLCQREGIDVQPGWTPRDAWKALEGKGYSVSEVYKELKKTGKAPTKSGLSEKPVQMSPEEAKKVSTSHNKMRDKWSKNKSELDRERSKVEGLERTIQYGDDWIYKKEKDYNLARERYEEVKTGKTSEELEAEEKKKTDDALEESKFINSLTSKPPEEGTPERKRWEKTILDNAEEAIGYKRPENDPEAEEKWKRACLSAMSYDIGSYVANKMKPGLNKKISDIDKLKKERFAIKDMEDAKDALEIAQEAKKDRVEELKARRANVEKLEKSVERYGKKLEAGKEAYKNAVNSRFPNYEDCKSYEDIEDKLRANGCISDEKDVYFANIGVESAVMASKSIGEFYEKFPALKNKLGGIQTEWMEPGTYAGSLGHDTIYLNFEKFGSLEKMKEMFQKDVDKKYHPEGTDVRAILYHEMAHQMDSYLTTLLRADDRKKYWLERKNLSEVILDEVSEKLGADRERVKHAVSAYATKRSTSIDPSDDKSIDRVGFYNGHDTEFFAEAISEYLCSEHPRQVAVETFNVLQKYIKQAEEATAK